VDHVSTVYSTQQSNIPHLQHSHHLQVLY